MLFFYIFIYTYRHFIYLSFLLCRKFLLMFMYNISLILVMENFYKFIYVLYIYIVFIYIQYISINVILHNLRVLYCFFSNFSTCRVFYNFIYIYNHFLCLSFLLCRFFKFLLFSMYILFIFNIGYV